MKPGKLKLKGSKDTVVVHSNAFGRMAKKPIDDAYEELQASEPIKVKDQVITHRPFLGQGTIVTSQKTIMGFETEFTKQFESGDFIEIRMPGSGNLEEKQIILVMGDSSVLVHEQFSESVSQPISFSIRKKTTFIKGENVLDTYKVKLQKLKDDASRGTLTAASRLKDVTTYVQVTDKTKPINKPTVDVRVKKGLWSYQKKTFEVEEGSSREALLNMRQKINNDKFCW